MQLAICETGVLLINSSEVTFNHPSPETRDSVRNAALISFLSPELDVVELYQADNRDIII